MEQTMSKNAKPLLMMKALVLAYAVTGILLLLLAYLLYKMGLGESQVNLGIMVIYIVSSLLGGFYLGKKIKVRRFVWGMGVGSGYALLLIAVTFLTEHHMRGDIRKWHFYSSFVSREVPLEVCFPERNTCLKITAML